MRRKIVKKFVLIHAHPLTPKGGSVPTLMKIRRIASWILHVFVAKPTEMHLTAIKRIFRYLKGTIHMGLWYPKDSGFELKAFADADYAGCHDTRRSTSGSAQFLGHRLVSWSSKKQKSTAILHYGG
ncbi:hypothetical protein Tco_0736467 [Tanacetum coccineum]